MVNFFPPSTKLVHFSHILPPNVHFVIIYIYFLSSVNGCLSANCDSVRSLLIGERTAACSHRYIPTDELPWCSALQRGETAQRRLAFTSPAACRCTRGKHLCVVSSVADSESAKRKRGITYGLTSKSLDHNGGCMHVVSFLSIHPSGLLYYWPPSRSARHNSALNIWPGWTRCNVIIMDRKLSPRNWDQLVVRLS